MDQDAGKVRLINIALSRIGEFSITALDEGTPQQQKAVTFFTNTRKALLRAHPWNFAVHEVELARIPDETPYDFQYAFQLPADFLRLLKVHDARNFKVQGRRVLSDEKVCRIKYVRDVEDPSQWDSTFTDAFTYQLAGDMTYGLVGQASMSELMLSLASQKLKIAKHIDATEDVQDAMDDSNSAVYAARF
ncbi:MAG: hypothetical protein Q7V53_07200 [Caldisericota bacterium]|nr:hypothetical protein [Caldisericota bacterium]